MLRTRLATSYIKRTFRPLYGWTQMTPTQVFLDPAWDRSVPIWPGMVFTKTSGENVTLYGASPAVPYGFGALYVGGDGIDEPLDAGINTFAVWVMAPDAQAEVLAPAFDTTANWAEAGTGAEKLVYGIRSGVNRGKLTTDAGTSNANGPAVARLIKTNSATKITIGGLRPGAYAV